MSTPLHQKTAKHTVRINEMSMTSTEIIVALVVFWTTRGREIGGTSNLCAYHRPSSSCVTPLGAPVVPLYNRGEGLLLAAILICSFEKKKKP